MSDAVPQAVNACHELLVWLTQKLDRIPRNRRYTLGTRMESVLLEVLEHLTTAAYSKPADKTRHLEAANIKLDVLRHLWRAARELEAVDVKAHRFGANLMLGIGSQIGGWRKASAQPPK